MFHRTKVTYFETFHKVICCLKYNGSTFSYCSRRARSKCCQDVFTPSILNRRKSMIPPVVNSQVGKDRINASSICFEDATIEHFQMKRATLISVPLRSLNSLSNWEALVPVSRLFPAIA